jgi:hypothetical protein
LEKAGEIGNFNVVADKTPVFLKKLTYLIENMKPEKTSSAAPASSEDMLYLKDKLYELRAACSTYNIRVAETVLNDLKQKKWPQETDDAINEIQVSLLRGEFKKVLSIVEEILNTPNK